MRQPEQDASFPYNVGSVIHFDRVRPASLALIGLTILLAGCTAPLGPAYALRNETVTVRYNDRLVQPTVDYSVQAEALNTGNRPLDLLRIHAPQPAQPPTAASAQSDTTSSSGRAEQGWLPVPLQPPLARDRSRRIRFSDLVPVRGWAIFLEPEDWFPAFLPPQGLFGEAESWAPRTQLDIFAPAGDRALATGRLRRVRAGRPGGETEYVYEISDRNFPPFLLIGKYDEQKVRADGRDVLFWTRRPFDSRCAQAVADQAVATEQLYRSMFGNVARSGEPIRVIQIPSEGGPPSLASDVPGGSVPSGVLFSEDPAEICRRPEAFFFRSARALAATWFGWAVQPDPGAQAILGTGIQNYAALIAEEKQEGPGAQMRQVAGWLAEYDRLSSRTNPLPPGNLGGHPTRDQERLAGVQSALSFVALEDRVGAAPVQRALRDLVGSLSGSAAGPDELRSALERESGRDLYEFFNQWLGRAGIPADFRKRYAAQGRPTAPVDRAALLHGRRK